MTQTPCRCRQDPFPHPTDRHRQSSLLLLIALLGFYDPRYRPDHRWLRPAQGGRRPGLRRGGPAERRGRQTRRPGRSGGHRRRPALGRAPTRSMRGSARSSPRGRSSSSRRDQLAARRTRSKPSKQQTRPGVYKVDDGARKLAADSSRRSVTPTAAGNADNRPADGATQLDAGAARLRRIRRALRPERYQLKGSCYQGCPARRPSKLLTTRPHRRRPTRRLVRRSREIQGGHFRHAELQDGQGLTVRGGPRCRHRGQN